MCAHDQRQGKWVARTRARLCTRRAGIRAIIVDSGCSTVACSRHGDARSYRDRYWRSDRACPGPDRDRTAHRGAACGAEGVMMLAGTDLQVLVAKKPVDFRKQADTLAALVQEVLAADPYSGAVYVFRAKRSDRVKLLWWDGTGVCLLTKRLEGGQFRWPTIEDGVVRLTARQLAALLEGTEWSGLGTREVERPRAAS